MRTLLSDQERKVLRILFNFSRNNGRMPETQELVSKSGRTPTGIQEALSSLRKKGYIMGKKLSEVVIIEAWEKVEEKQEKKRDHYLGMWQI